MKTFDYEHAWENLAKPMFEALPADVHELYQRVIDEAGGLQQSPNLNMPWPEYGAVTVDHLPGYTLRQLFDKMPAETLATAARVIHSYGHWYVGRNADRVGGHWKFANYADQSLAARIHETLDPRWPTSYGIGYRIHDGFLRVHCSTPYSWTWEEIGLGTQSIFDHCKALGSNQPPRADRMTRPAWDIYATRAQEFFGLLKAAVKPAGRIAEFIDMEAAGYYADDSEIKARHVAIPANIATRRAELINSHGKKTGEMAIELKGMLWLLDHGIDTENAIYYRHTDRFCFGWRAPVTDKVLSQLLDVLTEFPFSYEIKTNGRKLEATR